MRLCVWEVKGSSFQILIEVDHLQDVPSPYIQIKGINKEVVAAAGSTLKLDGSYTTKVLTSGIFFLSDLTLLLLSDECSVSHQKQSKLIA